MIAFDFTEQFKSTLIANTSMATPLQQQPPFICEDRIMLSRTEHDSMKIISSIEPAMRTPGCCVCCNASSPASCCCLSELLPCYDQPEYILKEIQASRYVLLRENSLEYNDPYPAFAQGKCCGYNYCRYRVQDRISVVYYDDEMFEHLRDSSRACNDQLTFFFGGDGERVLIDSRFCLGLCIRGSFPCCCWPCCLPSGCVRSYLFQHKIKVDDANHVMKRMVKIRDLRRRSMGGGMEMSR